MMHHNAEIVRQNFILLELLKFDFNLIFFFSEAKVPCQCQSHLGRVLLDDVYPLTTEQLFAILFSPIPWYQHLEQIVSKTGMSDLNFKILINEQFKI